MTFDGSSLSSQSLPHKLVWAGKDLLGKLLPGLPVQNTLLFSNALFCYYSKFPSDTAHSASHTRMLNSPIEKNPLRSFSKDGYIDLKLKLNFTFFKQFVSIFTNTDYCWHHVFLYTDCKLTIWNTLKIFY